LISGTRAPLVELKFAATFVDGIVPPETFCCALAALTLAHNSSDDKSSLFMMFPLRADPTSGIRPLDYGKQPGSGLSMALTDTNDETATGLH
jgi:hypothetical protein